MHVYFDAVQLAPFRPLIDALYTHNASYSCSTDLQCETEDCGSVPGRGVREGKRVRLGPSCRRDDLGCGVDDFEPLRMDVDEGGATERSDAFSRPAPTDPYTDFAFGLDVVTHDRCSPGKTNESSASVPTGLDYPSTLETLRHLESTIGPPADADTSAEPTLMNVDTTFLTASTPQGLSRGEEETQCRGLPSTNSLNLLPFHLSTSKLQPLATSSSLPVATTAHNLALTHLDRGSSLKTPVEIRPQVPRISATLSGSELALGSTEPASSLMKLDSVDIPEKVFAGPSLFLDDDGME